MAAYNLFDLLNQITELINDGYSYAEISEHPSDDEFPASLSFSTLEGEFEGIEYDGVDSLPDDYDYSHGANITADTPCFILTLRETSTTLHALDNALEYFKECSANKEKLYNRDTLDQIKSSSVHCRNLQAKVRKFLNRFE